MTQESAPAGKWPPIVHRASFALSILGNLALGAFLLWTKGTPQLDGLDFGYRTDLRKLETALVRADMPRNDARRVVLALLEGDERGASDYAYWRPAPVRDAIARVKAFERDEQIRAVLLRDYGSNASEEPAFRSIFRPLDPQLPMLSSDDQLRLEAARVDAVAGWLGSQAEGTLGLMSRPDTVIPDFRDSLAPAERFEFDLRTSALARALTGLDYTFSMVDFRETFEAVAKLHPEAIDTATTLSLTTLMSDPSVLSMLAGSLGQARLAELQRALDPVYGLVRRVASSWDISKESADAAYELLTRLEESSQAGRLATTGEDTEVSSELESLLGSEVAREILRVMALRRASAATLSPLQEVQALFPGQPVRIVPRRGATR